MFENIGLGADVLGVQQTLLSIGIWIAAFIFLAVILKGLALYKAARLQEKVWFWILLIVNTMGILELIYLYIRRNK